MPPRIPSLWLPLVALTIAGCVSNPSGPCPFWGACGSGLGFGLGPVDSAASPAPADPVVPVVTDGAGPVILPPSPEAVPGGSGAGGSGGAPAGTAGVAGQVVDEREAPVAGAVVRLLDGRQATAGTDGRFTFTGAADGPVAVSATGYATSLVWQSPAGAALHLRKTGGGSGPFVRRSVVLYGRVNWGAGPHSGGVAYYQDQLDSIADPVDVAPDGTYALTVTTTRGGEPRGTVLILASDGAEGYLVGISPVFSPFSGQTPGVIEPLATEWQCHYAIADAPPGLTEFKSTIQMWVEGALSFQVEGPAMAAGPIPFPHLNRIPGQARLVVTASDPAHERESVVSLPVSAETTDVLTASFLAVPELAIVPASRRVGWAEVPGAAGYMASVRPSGWVAPRWEAWKPTAQPINFTAADWPGSGTELSVTAVAAPGVTTREVAAVSARALRVTPWLSQATYRISTCKKVF